MSTEERVQSIQHKMKSINERSLSLLTQLEMDSKSKQESLAQAIKILGTDDINEMNIKIAKLQLTVDRTIVQLESGISMLDGILSTIESRGKLSPEQVESLKILSSSGFLKSAGNQGLTPVAEEAKQPAEEAKSHKDESSIETTPLIEPVNGVNPLAYVIEGADVNLNTTTPIDEKPSPTGVPDSPPLVSQGAAPVKPKRLQL